MYKCWYFYVKKSNGSVSDDLCLLLPSTLPFQTNLVNYYVVYSVYIGRTDKLITTNSSYFLKLYFSRTDSTCLASFGLAEFQVVSITKQILSNSDFLSNQKWLVLAIAMLKNAYDFKTTLLAGGVSVSSYVQKVYHED